MAAMDASIWRKEYIKRCYSVKKHRCDGENANLVQSCGDAPDRCEAGLEAQGI